MTTNSKVETIADLEGRYDLALVTDSQDITFILDYIGNDEEYDGLFAAQTDGDYTEIYGYKGGATPYYGKLIYKLL